METASPPTTLTYRLFREDDLPGVLRLWAEDTAWGAITAGQWREWYVETPYEPAIIAVAEGPGGEVVGQLAFTPARVQLGGHEVKAVRLSAPILRKERSAAGEGMHPAVRLYTAGVRAAQDQGFVVGYAFTQRTWLPFLRSGSRFGLPPVADAEFGCDAYPLDGPAPDPEPRTEGHRVEPVTCWDHDFQGLWDEARDAWPVRCGLVRSPVWLRYKNGGHLSLAVRDEGGGLLGYAAVRRDGLLVDLLARGRSDAGDVLAAALRWLASHPSERPGFGRLKVMRSPGAVLPPGPWVREDYVFAFLASALHGSVSLESIDPSLWYLMPGD